MRNPGKRSSIHQNASEKRRSVEVADEETKSSISHPVRSLKQLASDFGIGAETLRRALLSAGIEVGKINRFTHKQAFEALSGAGLLRTAKAREAAARAEMLELKTSEKRGDMMPTVEVEAFLVRHLQPLSDALNAMPPQLAARVNPTDPQFAQEVLQVWVDQTREMMRK